jgi:hypothetical protein
MHADQIDPPAEAGLERRPGAECDESAFLYLLGVERSRADRANLALHLLLVSLEAASGKAVPMGRVTAARVFAGLRRSLRETDVIGWYRQESVAGAVLSSASDQPGLDLSAIIQDRVTASIRRELPDVVVRNLKMRVIQLRQPLVHS